MTRKKEIFETQRTPLALLVCLFVGLLNQGLSAQEEPIKQDAPRWTAFLRITVERVPEEDWESFYGFTVDGESTVVKDRFLYPMTDPPIFSGDRIISVKSRAVETKAQLFAALDSYSRSPISIKVERASREEKPRVITINLHRADADQLRRYAGQRLRGVPYEPQVKVPVLADNEVYRFGTVPSNIATEIVGFCEDLNDASEDPIPVLVGGPVPGSSMSKSEFAARQKLFKSIGDFVLLDKRNPKDSSTHFKPYVGSVLSSSLQRDFWKTGERLRLADTLVLIEDPIFVMVDGKKRKVSVLTLCEFGVDNIK